VARYPALAGTSQAILDLLQGASAETEFAGVTFAHYHGSNLEKPMSEGVSLWLYRVTVNPARNLPPRIEPDGTRRPAALPLDLHYLLSAWAVDPIQEQRLFGWAVRTIEDTPLLPAGVLNRHLAEPGVFRPDESVELAWQPLSLSECLDLWDGVRLKMRPSASYLARIVALESSAEAFEHPDVQTRELAYGAVT
jgi:Pvc16 N-terminal domain